MEKRKKERKREENSSFFPFFRLERRRRRNKSKKQRSGALGDVYGRNEFEAKRPSKGGAAEFYICMHSRLRCIPDPHYVDTCYCGQDIYVESAGLGMAVISKKVSRCTKKWHSALGETLGYTFSRNFLATH